MPWRQQSDQSIDVYRFDENRQRAEPRRLAGQILRRVCCHEHRGEVASNRSECLIELNAIHMRHPDVDQREVAGMTPRLFQCLL